MTTGFIGFGANKSNTKRSLMTARTILEKQGVRVISQSSLRSSPAWPPGFGRPDYTNAVIKFEYSKTADALIALLMSTEAKLGRVRSIPNASRIIDLDLLIFGDETRNTARLTLPHPRMLDRAFVLLPLCEIDPIWLSELAKLPSSDIESMEYIGRW